MGLCGTVAPDSYRESNAGLTLLKLREQDQPLIVLDEGIRLRELQLAMMHRLAHCGPWPSSDAYGGRIEVDLERDPWFFQASGPAILAPFGATFDGPSGSGAGGGVGTPITTAYQPVTGGGASPPITGTPTGTAPPPPILVTSSAFPGDPPVGGGPPGLDPVFTPPPMIPPLTGWPVPPTEPGVPGVGSPGPGPEPGSVVLIPEPGTVLLFGLGIVLALVAGQGWRG